MVNKKTVFVTILILLAIFIPLTIFSYMINREKNPFDKNPNHDFYYDNKLWFYNGNELLSTYECNTDKCGLASSEISDNEYGINYYQNDISTKLKIIDDDFVFISDGAVINLYSIKTNNVLQSYKSVKTYNTKIKDNAYILQNKDDLYGVISINGVISSILPFNYDFIALKNDYNGEELLSDKYIVKQNDKWYIVSNTNSILSSGVSDVIVDYNDNYYVGKDNNNYHLYDYTGNSYLTDKEIVNYTILNKYIGVVYDNYLNIYDNLNNTYLKSISISNELSKIELEQTNNSLQIKVDETVIDSLALT